MITFTDTFISKPSRLITESGLNSCTRCTVSCSSVEVGGTGSSVTAVSSAQSTVRFVVGITYARYAHRLR